MDNSYTPVTQALLGSTILQYRPFAGSSLNQVSAALINVIKTAGKIIAGVIGIVGDIIRCAVKLGTCQRLSNRTITANNRPSAPQTSTESLHNSTAPVVPSTAPVITKEVSAKKNENSNSSDVESPIPNCNLVVVEPTSKEPTQHPVVVSSPHQESSKTEPKASSSPRHVSSSKQERSSTNEEAVRLNDPQTASVLNVQPEPGHSAMTDDSKINDDSSVAGSDQDFDSDVSDDSSCYNPVNSPTSSKPGAKIPLPVTDDGSRENAAELRDLEVGSENDNQLGESSSPHSEASPTDDKVAGCFNKASSCISRYMARVLNTPAMAYTKVRRFWLLALAQLRG